uniref:hypothetical protein n=1 Tax=Ciborinia camelliae TaxID=647257 RepID=UPI001FA6CF92|nr:hypothetical protein MRV96_mgp34 [Ciborinia camelliae]UNB14725.1 hypothetical protein [Ciborinia camelliae]
MAILDNTLGGDGKIHSIFESDLTEVINGLEEGSKKKNFFFEKRPFSVELFYNLDSKNKNRFNLDKFRSGYSNLLLTVFIMFYIRIIFQIIYIIRHLKLF